MSQKTTKEITVNSIKNMLEADIRPLLGKINVPTLIIHGKNDQAAPWEGAKYMHENIRGSKMHIFEDKGHFTSVTAADKFNKILKEFIMTGELLKD